MGKYKVGIDVGSTTIKVLVIDENNNCFLPFFRNLNENENKEINDNIKNIKNNKDY